MIDSFSAAARCAEEALRDPGGLRFAHLPSLVAFVERLRDDPDGADRDPRELAQGVRLNRLLWELGLRGEAARLFDLFVAWLRRMPAGTDDTVALGNALAAVGVAMGRGNDVRAFLKRLVSEAPGGTEVDEVLAAVAWINLAVVDLSLGDTDSAASWARSARSRLRMLDVPHSAELDQVLSAVELRLADTPLGMPPDDVLGGPDSAGATRLRELAVRTAEFVRERGDRDPRAFLSVAGLAVARVRAALGEGDTRGLWMSVQVLEVACQRLSAMLGADHPEALGVLADLAAVQLESARVIRSAVRLERAVAQLASVSERLDARLGPEHPRSVAALTNLVTARVESVRASDEAHRADKAQRTAEVLAAQARRAGERLGADHPVTRLVRASSRTCRRIAARDGDLWGHGTTMLMTLTDAPRGWVTDPGAYRSFDEVREPLGRRGRQEDDLGDAAGPEQRRARPGERGPAAGELVSGTVIEIDDHHVLLFVGGITGVVPAGELSLRHHADPRSLALGDSVRALALGRRDADGHAVLSLRRAQSLHAWTTLETVKVGGTYVNGTVIDVVRGGLVLDIGVRAFLPADLVDLRRGADLRGLLGKSLEARITELDRARGLVMLSRRAWLEENEFLLRPRTPGAVQPGQILSGTVTEVARHVAFVDVDSFTGVLPREELSWLHVDDASDVVGVGQRVTVRVLSLDDRKRWILSRKAAQDRPWQAFTTSHRPGEIVEATITKLLSFGALVRVDEGIDGLVHHSELGDPRASSPYFVSPGARIFVAVSDIDYDRRRLSFSLREADALVAGLSEGRCPPDRYGMAAYCDSRGRLILPDGYDEEEGVWLPGFRAQREHWDRRLNEMTELCRRHRTWVDRRGGSPRP